MEGEGRALQLVERIYESVVEPDSWNLFLADLSAALGGAAIQLSLSLPDEPTSEDAVFRVGIDAAYHAVFVKHAVEGLPWGSLDHEAFRGRFGLANEVVGAQTVEETSLFREYMEPQGLAPEWPVCHLIRTERGHPLAGVVVYRRRGGRALDDDDLRLLDALVPHLARSYALHCTLADARQQRRALTEVIDRLPVGVILLDGGGRAVLMNRSVEKILALNDGFRLVRGRPGLADQRESRTLGALLAAALEADAPRGGSTGGVMSATRPSGRRAFPLMVGPLLAPSPGTTTHEARAVLFIGDPEGGKVGTGEVLQALYQLTPAEAELVRLIAEGRSLDEVATERGVSLHTVRSQLKQVFLKTDTCRQGELVHLVLTGVAAIREGEEPEGPG